MARARNIPIDLHAGTSKDVKIVFDDAPDLTAAQITFKVKETITDTEVVLTKTPNLTKSTALVDGEFTLSFTPTETADLTPRTYVYEIQVQIGDDIYIPLLGDFNLFNNL